MILGCCSHTFRFGRGTRPCHKDTPPRKGEGAGLCRGDKRGVLQFTPTALGPLWIAVHCSSAEFTIGKRGI
jgi:hypothetical protein